MLEQLSSPAELRRLPAGAMDALAGEIRRKLVESVSRTGGHLGPNLGVVELTLALHRVFESPRDAIVWDTGHQSYVHKLLTGRQDFDRLRHAGGLSGYPSRAESEHDLVENSHASTALSYADGLAKAFALRQENDRAVVAVVGDGALTGGMCWEALNNLGAADRPVVVVLNDNGRSYSPTVGGVAAHLAELRDGCGTSLFDQLGFHYLGPIDGHHTAALEAALRSARAYGRPVVVHCLTSKGKGHADAEADLVDHMHTIGPAGKSASSVGWTDIMAEELVAIADERPDVVGITAAMLHPTGLHQFARKFSDRVYDVGIAEQHAVTSAAGLATGGMHPVVCVYATFLNRAFDQLLMDVALHRLPVTFVLDRAGITGNDGPSHHGMWDLSLLGTVPGMRVAAPRDGSSLRALLREAVSWDGPSALRFPKGSASADIAAIGHLGRGDLLRGGLGGDTLLLPVGPCAHAALQAADRLDEAVTVADPRWVLPIDPALVRAAGNFRLVVTIEDNGVAGGFGDTYARALREAGCRTPVRTLALRQEFLAHGDRGTQLSEQCLDADGIIAAVSRRNDGADILPYDRYIGEPASVKVLRGR
ncbi:1-deoxy-D-xylulose-5-phosphate synthase [Fodinicola acaciae]|uniref:1-deoxy-D-xylulose-5-phosphate synthase n=1 Tax=Fodinicola acaciae TaxID=2681555 RepID=UPI001C9E2C41|nr:1-deoxy-D-xylulose-5-phosphate synthase [Fodinicola acaciae]